MCKHVAEFKPDVVITEKGLSDLATHFLTKAGISAIRRLRKTDNNRIARACGATIVHRPEEIRESDVGTGAGLFEVKKIGDEFFTFIVDCKVISRLECCLSASPVHLLLPSGLCDIALHDRRRRRLAVSSCAARRRTS
jgi:chaperonin GroEL (HSP60 family)